MTDKKPTARVHGQGNSVPASSAAAETPSETMVKSAIRTGEGTDARGRVIGVRRLSPLDRMRLFAAAGPELSKNEQWIGAAALAASCCSIDGDQVPKPASRLQIEALVERLDEDGLQAIADVYRNTFGFGEDTDTAESAKN